MEGKYGYEDLLEIIKTLRSENGCPWDRKQTHTSLRSCMMEEAAEVLAAIRIYDQSGSYENLQEELGDVLLQVVMHSQIAGEEGLFTMEDVIDGVARKMVRRHPHVFGSVQVSGPAEVLENWEEIKRREKEGRKEAECPLQEIPRELPALTRAVKVLKKADKLYEPGEGYEKSLTKLKDGVERLAGRESAQDREETKRVIGDILMSLCNIARIDHLSLEQILADRVETCIEYYEKPVKS
ncbi:MAG: MazG family protein [Roseburia sp.]|nr:MazG family protein [Roseburia sp.]